VIDNGFQMLATGFGFGFFLMFAVGMSLGMVRWILRFFQ
jgi:hypothetical protein